MAKQKSEKLQAMLPWLIWAICCLYYFYSYCLQAAPNAMAYSLMHDFKINAVGLGNFGSYFFYPFVILQLFVGFLFDRFGVRKIISFGIATTAFGCLLFAVAPVFFVAELGRFFMGVGTAFSMIGGLLVAASWFSPKRFSALYGMLIAIGMLGAVFGSGPLSVIISKVGWREAMIILCIFGVILSVAAWFIIHDYLAEETDGIDDLVLQKPSLRVGLKRIIKVNQNWICGVCAGLVYYPTIILGMIFGVPFVVRAYHTSQHVAAGVVSAVFVGWIIGGPFWGWFFERIGRSRKAIVFGAVGLLLVSVCIIYIPIWSHLTLIILFVAFGFFSSSELLPFIFVRHLNAQRYIGTALGFANFLGTIGGAILPTMIGFIIDLGWDGKMANGIHQYSVHNYQFALSIIPLLAIAALFIAPFVQSLRDDDGVKSISLPISVPKEASDPLC